MQTPVLRNGKLTFLLTDDTNRTLAYLMRNNNAGVLVAINRNSSPQTLAIDLKGMLPSAVLMKDALGSMPDVTAVNGILTINLPASAAAVLKPAEGQDLSFPAAPGSLAATPGNGKVDLAWTGEAGVASYNIYRSQISGGGYSKIGSSTTLAYTDSTVTNGKVYYYVVKSVSGNGVEGQASNEAMAAPAFPIGWVGLMPPSYVFHVISVNPTEPIFGQAYVAGLTDSSGDPNGILAQVGFGARGSVPASWNTWVPMAFDVQVGNNFQYKGALRPEALGDYDFLVRFSTNGGLAWSYGLYHNAPGLLRVAPSADTTPPAAPANLRATDWSTEHIALAWDAVADAAEYWVYRHIQGQPYGDRIGLVRRLPRPSMIPMSLPT